MDNHFKDNIKKLIASGKTGDAIERLLQYRSGDKDIADEIIALSGRYEKYLQDKHRHIKDSKELDIEFNRINSAILYILGKETKQKRRTIYVYLKIILIALIAIGAVFIIKHEINTAKTLRISPELHQVDTLGRGSAYTSKISNTNSDSILIWWEGLSNDWKQLLLSSAGSAHGSKSELSNPDFEKVFSTIEINLEYKKIETLEPLIIGKFNRLKRIYKGANLTSLKGISYAPNIIYLDIDNSKVDDINELNALKNLKILSILNTKIPVDQVNALIKKSKNEIHVRK